jgi:hypothetical protein
MTGDMVPFAATGGGMLTMVAALYWGLYKGWLLTGREGAEKNAEIAENRATIRELLSQNATLIEERRIAVNALEALRAVAERER